MPRRGFLLLTASAVCSSLAAPSLGAPVADEALVDMVVVQVEGTVVTFSELAAETRLAILRQSGPDAARRAVPTPALFAAVLRNIVQRELLLQEVRRLQLREVSEVDTKSSLEALEAPFVSRGDFQRFLERAGFVEEGEDRGQEPPPGLIAILRAELEVERFLDVRVRRSLVIREADVLACFEANRAHFGDQPFSQAQAAVKNRIREQREREAVRELLAQLEERANVRYAPGLELPKNVEADRDELGFRCPTAGRGRGAVGR